MINEGCFYCHTKSVESYPEDECICLPCAAAHGVFTQTITYDEVVDVRAISPFGFTGDNDTYMDKISYEGYQAVNCARKDGAYWLNAYSYYFGYCHEFYTLIKDLRCQKQKLQETQAFLLLLAAEI